MLRRTVPLLSEVGALEGRGREPWLPTGSWHTSIMFPLSNFLLLSILTEGRRDDPWRRLSPHLLQHIIERHLVEFCGVAPLPIRISWVLFILQIDLANLVID